MPKNSDINHSVPLTNREDVHLVSQALANVELALETTLNVQTAYRPDLEENIRLAKRNRMLFDLGVYSAMPIDTLLNTRAIEPHRGMLVVSGSSDPFMTRVINKRMRREMADYIKDLKLNDSDLLFVSDSDPAKPLTPYEADIIVRNAGRVCGIDNLGLNTLRKTFGRIWVEEGRDVNYLCKYYGIADKRKMLEYLGVDPNTDLAAKASDNFNPEDDRDIYDVIAQTMQF